MLRVVNFRGVVIQTKLNAVDALLTEFHDFSMS